MGERILISAENWVVDRTYGGMLSFNSGQIILTSFDKAAPELNRIELDMINQSDFRDGVF